MPWWAHRMAVEGLTWETPWLPAVRVFHPPEGSQPFEESDFGSSTADPGDFAELGFDVRTVD